MSFHNYVLVAPNAKIDRPHKNTFDTSNVVKADSYISHLQKETDGASYKKVITELTKVVGRGTLEKFADKLVRLHKPVTYNYSAKFGIDEDGVTAHQGNTITLVSNKPQESIEISTARVCYECGVSVDGKVEYFCNMNKNRFNSKVLCRSCQQLPEISPMIGSVLESEGQVSCEACNSAVDGKVVYFCNINKKRFNGKILCRDCQGGKGI